MKPDTPIEPMLRQAFGAPLPEEARHAMREQLEAARSAWRAQARQRPRLLFAAHRRISWVAAAAGLLLLALGGARWMLTRAPASRAAAASSYVCAIAHYPEKSATCTAVFYSQGDPSLWTERRTVLLDANGNMTEVIAYNPERSQI